MAEIRGNNFVARCVVCDEALSSYEAQSSFSESFTSWFESRNGHRCHGKRLHFVFCKCTGCGMGAIAKYIEDVDGIKHLRDFYPEAPIKLKLPSNTPKDILSEFRSAERCASIHEYRPAGAMLRSTLEKVLNDHGYDERYLTNNINNATKEGVLTIALQKRAFNIVKALGDEILHQSWRNITEEQYEDSHEYTQRIIENFYDDPETVREILIEKKRISGMDEHEDKCDGCEKVKPVWAMIHDDLWNEIVEDGSKYLCVNCIEKLLGRELTPDDLEPVILNHRLLVERFPKELQKEKWKEVFDNS